MSSLFLATICAVLAIGYCGNYTVTQEAWFDVEVRGLDGPYDDYRGRFVIALFGETTPVTSMNFASIAKGFKHGNSKLTFKNSKVHRVVQDFLLQMGDITIGDGTGGKSIYGDTFLDENFILSHRSIGTVAMANHGKDTNGSQFFILLNKARWLDGKHVVFGKVIKGMDVIRTLGDVPIDNHTGIPKKPIKIVDCGVNELDKKYELTEDQVDSSEDISDE